MPQFRRAVLVASVLLPLALGAGPRPREPFVVPVPGRGWQIRFEAPPLKDYMGRSRGDDFQFQGVGVEGFNVTAFVEAPANERPGHEACSEHYWPMAKRNPLIDQASVQVSKAPRFVRVAYLIAPPGNANGKVNRHVNYFIAHQGRWLDVHISQSPPSPDEDEVFAAFEKSLACGPSRPQPPTP